jgi:hypothetical protein
MTKNIPKSGPGHRPAKRSGQSSFDPRDYETDDAPWFGYADNGEGVGEYSGYDPREEEYKRPAPRVESAAGGIGGRGGLPDHPGWPGHPGHPGRPDGRGAHSGYGGYGGYGGHHGPQAPRKRMMKLHRRNH